jgi:hypothetical protein
MALKDNEKSLWDQVTPELMSDEEECENDTILLRLPSWRAESLNALISSLDQMLKDKGVTL